MDTSDYILLSELNDFIFCPRSIYWHHIYGNFNKNIYHEKTQTLGSIAHKSIDSAKYSSRKNILQGIAIISHEFGIQGKIDLYDARTGILTERKRKIDKVYRWYIWQLYGQYFCLSEMGYVVTGLRFHSLIDNKNYPIPLPSDREKKIFKKYIENFRSYQLSENFSPNPAKCARCIYTNLCDVS